MLRWQKYLTCLEKGAWVRILLCRLYLTINVLSSHYPVHLVTPRKHCADNELAYYYIYIYTRGTASYRVLHIFMAGEAYLLGPSRRHVQVFFSLSSLLHEYMTYRSTSPFNERATPRFNSRKCAVRTTLLCSCHLRPHKTAACANLA